MTKNIKFRNLYFVVIIIYLLSACSQRNTPTIINSPTNSALTSKTPTASHTPTLTRKSTNTYTPTSTKINRKAACLAKEVVNKAIKLGGGFYLKGGQGWDYNERRYIDINEIFSGYNYFKATYDEFGRIIGGFVTIGRGLDCSGLIMWAFNKAYGATEYSYGPITEQGVEGIFHQEGLVVIENVNELLPGDLLFFDNEESDNVMDHVAMYIGGNDKNHNVVEAANPELGLMFNSLDSLINQYKVQWIRLRRVIY